MKPEIRAAYDLQASGASLGTGAAAIRRVSPAWLPRRKSNSETARRSAISVSRRFALTSVQVFDAWLDPRIAGTWLFATAWRPMTQVAIEARVGGAFRFAAARAGEITEYTGAYIEITPHRRLVFSLALDGCAPVITRVAVEIAPLKCGCKLELVHDHVPRERARPIKARWTGVLYGLGATLEAYAANERSN